MEKKQFFMCEALAGVRNAGGDIVYTGLYIARTFDARNIRDAYDNLHKSLTESAERRGFLFDDGYRLQYQSGSIKRILR